MLNAASLVDWFGIGNQNSPNDYAVTSPTSVGGTFAERRAVAASLSDHTLIGGPFDWDSTLSASGTLQFSGGFDPVWFFGWFDSSNPTERIGIGAANPVPAGTGIRWQTQSGNVGATAVVSQDLTNDRSTSTFAPGTYDFTFNYDGAGHMTGTFGTLSFSRNYAQPTNTDLNLDRFGILQKSSTDDNVHTFVVHISDINYTGQTLYEEPAPALPGDYNNDGQVDAADYVVWRRNLNTNASLPNDTTPPEVSTEDYGVWTSNYGQVILTPSAPSQLEAVASPGQVSLSWVDNSGNENEFIVERRLNNGGGFVQIDTVPANATSYVDSGLPADTTFEYQVRAANGAGTSAASNIAAATTPQVTIAATNYSRTQIYHGSQASNYTAGDPSWTSWVGAWLMPNGDIMVGLTQASGPEQPFHDHPAPYNYSGLDIDVVYLRSSDGGNTWTKVTESDVSFTTADFSGLGTHANNSPATIALNDGSLIRRVYGWDYGEFPDMPGTAFIQRSTDEGLTWSAAPVSTDGGQTWSDPSPVAEFFLDPKQFTVQPTRLLRLSDGRLLMAGSVWNGPNTQSAPHEPLMMVSSDEAVTWQRVPFAGPGWNSSYIGRFSNEWDVAELPNGDLFVLSRVQNMPRWQAIFAKSGDSWQVQSAGATPIPHSGHPELLATREGPILSVATTGAMWTNDRGQTWNPLRVDSLPDLSGGDYRSAYYPHSLQTADGWVYVFSHRPSPGGDDNYGGANQAIFMDRFRLVPQAINGSGGSSEGHSGASQPIYTADATIVSAESMTRSAVSGTVGGTERNPGATLLPQSSPEAAVGLSSDDSLLLSLSENALHRDLFTGAEAIDAALSHGEAVQPPDTDRELQLVDRDQHLMDVFDAIWASY